MKMSTLPLSSLWQSKFEPALGSESLCLGNLFHICHRVVFEMFFCVWRFSEIDEVIHEDVDVDGWLIWEERTGEDTRGVWSRMKAEGGESLFLEFRASGVGSNEGRREFFLGVDACFWSDGTSFWWFCDAFFVVRWDGLNERLFDVTGFWEGFETCGNRDEDAHFNG